jgi:branched-subunit amino acid transport protein
MTSSWALILIAAATAILFRIAPFWLRNVKGLRDVNTPLYQFLNFSSQAMLGAMCYTLAFGRVDIIGMFQADGYRNACIIIALLGVLITTAKTGRVLSAITVMMVLYVGSQIVN